ncbi:hypothetical protein NWE61_00270 [Mycoplasmopsis felis]|uniref:hypothetical protein n=1 Tax=Mycoplasmopsis felis TaxID=33923 RepID=UPI0021DF5C1A|nr:hypothetical protein [Mycoplasmopsis felis]MCU9933680.1 hypothetical protein [Mycoplasmopsis felis]
MKPVVIKKSLTTAKEGAEFPLRWQFTDENKLEDGKSYTFIFWKTDGSEVIVFSKSNIETTKISSLLDYLVKNVKIHKFLNLCIFINFKLSVFFILMLFFYQNRCFFKKN